MYAQRPAVGTVRGVMTCQTTLRLVAVRLGWDEDETTQSAIDHLACIMQMLGTPMGMQYWILDRSLRISGPTYTWAGQEPELTRAQAAQTEKTVQAVSQLLEGWESVDAMKLLLSVEWLSHHHSGSDAPLERLAGEAGLSYPQAMLEAAYSRLKAHDGTTPLVPAVEEPPAKRFGFLRSVV